MVEKKMSNKLSYDEVKILVKSIQDNANKELAKVINNCEEPIILMQPPSYTQYTSKDDAINNPIVLKVKNKDDVSLNYFEYIYSSLSNYK